MSQEWLKKLAELSNDKELAKRAQQLEQKAERRHASRQPPSGGPSRSLFAAAFGYFIRFLFLIGLAQAAAMFVVANLEGLGNEPWGLIFHHTVWYPLTQPIFPAGFYDLLRDWFGVTPADLEAFYLVIRETIEQHQDLLVYAIPVGAALALTLFFLPAINAGRRRSPIRFLVFVANVAALALAGQLGPGSIVIWLAALVFSFAGGGARIRKAPRPQTASEPERSARAQPAPVSAAAAMGRAGGAVTAVRRDPTVVRRTVGGSWVRAR
jgi:hypothetical protein